MKKVALIVLAIGLIFGCKKKKTDEEPSDPIVAPTPANPNAPILTINIPADADGVLMASESEHEFGNGYKTRIGRANAFFYTAPGNYNYVDAGTVFCKDSVLPKVSGSYYFMGVLKNGQPNCGINYSSGSTWTISGTASVPAFSFSTAAFPSLGALTSSTLISKSAPYVATFTGAAIADSVVVMLTGDSTAIQKKTVLASAGTCSWTAAEIAKVKKQVSGQPPQLHLVSYTIISNTVTTKKYYMVNSNTATYKINTF